MRFIFPLLAVVRDELKARYASLNGNVVRFGRDDRTLFTAPEGGPLGYNNFRDRVWEPLLERTGSVTGTMQMLRHSYATARWRERQDGADTHGSPQRGVRHGSVRGCVAGADCERRRGRREALATEQ